VPENLTPPAHEPALAFRQLEQLDLDLDLAAGRCGRAGARRKQWAAPVRLEVAAIILVYAAQKSRRRLGVG